MLYALRGSFSASSNNIFVTYKKKINVSHMEGYLMGNVTGSPL